MTRIEIDDAPARLHDMWDAVLSDGEVQFTRLGVVEACLVWTGNLGNRAALIEELRDDIGYVSEGERLSASIQT